METILLEKDAEGVATITLNRPEALNAFNMKMFEELAAAVSDVRSDRDVKVVIITGAGRAFSSGIDITMLEEFKTMGLAEIRDFIRRAQGTLNALEDMEKPVIAAINGYALGLGCDLTLACDIRIASEDARFGEFYVRVGLVPDMGGTQRLPRIVGVGKAKELIFTGEMIDAKEAERIGLVNKVVPKDKLMDETRAFALRLAKGPTVAIGLAKIAINKGLGTDIKTGLEYEVHAQSICIQTEDVEEGIKAFLERREPKFKGR
ncbi:MAG: Enoyl-CoA hydratase/carnithine racemase [Candidatus Alkanophagales archaeon MCA70_species_1]|nr:Enoyl-CoA hydratase/carnithine racemase [Candidatus Alkanophaga volatiphilum]